LGFDRYTHSSAFFGGNSFSSSIPNVFVILSCKLKIEFVLLLNSRLIWLKSDFLFCSNLSRSLGTLLCSSASQIVACQGQIKFQSLRTNIYALSSFLIFRRYSEITTPPKIKNDRFNIPRPFRECTRNLFSITNDKDRQA